MLDLTGDIWTGLLGVLQCARAVGHDSGWHQPKLHLLAETHAGLA